MSENITLRCLDCELEKCDYSRKIIPYDSKEGCVRKVNNELAVQYHHYMEEVIPFLNQYKIETIKKLYCEMINVLFEIYQSPIENTLAYNGKIKNFNNLNSNRQNDIVLDKSFDL